MNPSLPLRSLPLLGAVAVLLATPLTGQPTTVQNDSISTVTPAGAIQTGFVEGEAAAAWLTSPCEGAITSVQVLWLSFTGGNPQSTEEAIRVYEAGAFPAPGALRVELLGPLMTDGFFNSFSLPTPLPVTAGEELVAEFTFFNTPNLLGPSVVTDVDGCQAGKNGIFAIPPGGWFSSCMLGLSGDFGIRAVVNCTGLPALIFSDGFESGDSGNWSLVVP